MTPMEGYICIISHIYSDCFINMYITRIMWCVINITGKCTFELLSYRFIFCFLLYCRSIHWFHKIFWLRTSSVMPGRICSIYTTLEIIVLLSTKHIRFSCVVLFCHLPMFIQWIFLFKLPTMNDTSCLFSNSEERFGHIKLD